MKVSIVRASLVLMMVPTSKPLTSPATRQAMFDASNLVMAVMPERPATRLAQASATVLPTGLMHPRPVTTTRRRLIGCSGLLVLHRVVDGVLHGGDLLGFFVGNLDAELVFEGHHEFHRVQRVGAQV